MRWASIGPLRPSSWAAGHPACFLPPLLGRLLAGIRCTARCTSGRWRRIPNPLTRSSSISAADAGVTRISAGIQSTSDRAPEAAAADPARPGAYRACPRAAGPALDRRSEPGFHSRDSRPGARRRCARTSPSWTSSPASHVSLYSLTYEPERRLPRLVDPGEIRRNSEGQDEELWFAGSEELKRGASAVRDLELRLPGKGMPAQPPLLADRALPGSGPGAVSTLPAAAVGSRAGRPGACRSAAASSSDESEGHRAVPPGPRRALGHARSRLVGSRGLPAGDADDGTAARGRDPCGARSRAGSGARFDELFPGLWAELGRPRTGAAARREHPAHRRRGRLLLDGLLDRGIARARGVRPRRRLTVTWP